MVSRTRADEKVSIMQGDIEKQIELEKQMTQHSVFKFRQELEKAIQQNNFSNTQTASVIIANILDSYINTIQTYLNNYGKGNAVRSTIAASIIEKLGACTAGYIACKVLLNSLHLKNAQSFYREIGQALEDEYKMRTFKRINSYYYDSIQDDLNSRGAKANRKKFITQVMFKKRLDFHTPKWSTTEKIQTGMILTKLFVDTTGLLEYKTIFKGKKQIHTLQPTNEISNLIENLNEKFEIMQPFFLPMVCEPKKWTDIFEGGYISPFLRKNKVIKNNDRAYLRKLKEYGTSRAFEALNTIQETKWQINNEVLDVVKLLWEEGQEVAGLPKRDDVPVQPYPFPDTDKNTVFTPSEKEIIAKWKRDTYETYKNNVASRSNRILTSQILRIAEQFKDYDTIWFPYQMDFRGRMYPIPVLLHPQGSDLAKGLLRFAEGKSLDSQEAKDWFLIQGANMFGYDKVSYKDRIKWSEEHFTMICDCASTPLEHREWMEADKPFQFLAWCFEYLQFAQNEYTFRTHIPIQLDGTCNGLQHYSALLRDKISGQAVNLINTPIPSDIYGIVAEKLTERLKNGSNNSINSRLDSTNTDVCVSNSSDTSSNQEFNKVLAEKWLNLGINRKLTKRPVMVLPYGGTQLSCRQYIEVYLRENYSTNFLWEHFNTGNNPNECIFKVSNWLSKYLWEAIRETLRSAIIGMDYLKALTRVKLQYDKAIEWITPMGLLIHQAYQKDKKHQIRTELYGKCLVTKFKSTTDCIDKQKQLNGICPNFIHSLDASCLMLWLLKCKQAGIKSFMSVHDCYAVLAPDTAKSAQLLREAFVEIYERPILDDFEADLIETLPDDIELPEKPQKGELDINEVINSDYFFN